MARGLLDCVVRDRAGNVVQNARVYVYETGTTTPVADLFASASGGSPQASLVSNASGRARGWLTTTRNVAVKATGNSGTAYYPSDPGTLLPDFTATPLDPVPVVEDPGDETTDDAALATVVAGLASHLSDSSDAHDASAVSETGGFADVQAALDALRLSGTFAARPAAGTAKRIYTATWAGTQIQRRYYDNGSVWVPLSSPFGVFNPLDYGADPTGAADSRQAFIDCITAAQADLDTGLPYESGTVQGAIIEVTAGQYTIATSITMAQVAGDVTVTQLLMRGVGGQASRTLAAPVIEFTTGGFICSDGAAHKFEFDHLAIIGNTAPAITATSTTITTAFGAIIRNCLVRSKGTGIPALKLSNVFECNAYNSTFRSPDSSTPSVLVESIAGAGGFQGWMFRFHACLFEENGVRWDCSGTNATLPGTNCGIYDCITENFDANVPLLHVRNTHATDSFTWYGIEIVNCGHWDGANPNDIVMLETLGSGNLTAKAIHIRKTPVSGGGKYVHCVQTGSGAVLPDFILVEGNTAAAGSITWGTTLGSGAGTMSHASGSGWQYESNGHATVGVAFAGRVAGESADRFRLNAWGNFLRGDGSATPTIFAGINNGTPESSVASGIGGFCIDYATGTGYLKTSGSGNTGWIALPTVVTAALLASTNIFTAAQEVRPTASGAVGLKVRASTTSPGNIQEWDDSAGTLISRIKSNGGVEIGAGGVTVNGGGVSLAAGNNIAAATSGAGTKYGTTASQLLGKWGVTAIAQPTTAVASATRVGGGGTALTDTDTFDGYTIAQIVKALRLAGNLA